MSNHARIYVTMQEGYDQETFINNNGYARETFINNPSAPIRENWMGAPTRSNFTGCGSAGHNQGKAPCAACASGQAGKRICNACRNNTKPSPICGGNACAWQPPTNQYARDSESASPESRPPHQPIFYF